MAVGATDLLADPVDVKKLLDLMDNASIQQEFKSYEWGHLGFVMADKLKELIDDTMIFLQK